MIPDALIIAILTFVGLVVAALIAGAFALGTQLVKWQASNQKLWLWNRALVDHIYRGLGPPPPTPPTDLFE